MSGSEREGHRVLLRVAFPYAAASLAYAFVALGAEELMGDHLYKVSGQAGSVFGLVVAFFLGFRMNTAYDRWWEARKILGELTNNTRSFANKAYTYLVNGRAPAAAGDALVLLRWYIAQVSAELCDQPPVPAPAGLAGTHDITPTHKRSNELLLALSVHIERVLRHEAGWEKNDLMQHIQRFYEIQGKAERIKNTPFLPVYRAFSRMIVFGYVLLTPVLIGDIDVGGERSGWEWLSVPLIAILGAAFLTINRLANLYGAPFSDEPTSVQVEALCDALAANVGEVEAKVGRVVPG